VSAELSGFIPLQVSFNSSSCQEHDRFVIACAVEDVKNFDHIGGDAIEDEVVAMRRPPYAALLVTWHQRIGTGHRGQLGATARL
jgi:hypothetical protein